MYINKESCKMCKEIRQSVAREAFFDIFCGRNKGERREMSFEATKPKRGIW